MYIGKIIAKLGEKFSKHSKKAAELQEQMEFLRKVDKVLQKQYSTFLKRAEEGKLLPEDVETAINIGELLGTNFVYEVDERAKAR